MQLFPCKGNSGCEFLQSPRSAIFPTPRPALERHTVITAPASPFQQHKVGAIKPLNVLPVCHAPPMKDFKVF